MINKLFPFWGLEKIIDSETKRIFRDVNYQANQDSSRSWNKFAESAFLTFVAGVILVFDYSTARVMFAYMDPTLGGISLGPEILALSVPIAVIAIHLLIAEDEGKTLEYRLKRLAGVGVIVFIFGIASMFSLVLYDSTDGMGGTDQNNPLSGIIGNQGIGAGNDSVISWLPSGLVSVFASVPPLIFFAGMTLILFVTIYVTHKLLEKIEQHYDFLKSVNLRRARELNNLFDELDGLFLEIEALDSELAVLKKHLPRDPEQHFARIASAAIRDALHHMKKALNGLGNPNVLIKKILTRKATIPRYIETRKQGLPIIAEIKYRTSPYAILRELGPNSPQKEEE